MKKKFIIAAMAACLVMGTTEASFASTCSKNDRIAEMMQKLQQCISEQVRGEICQWPNFQLPGVNAPEQDAPETEAPETEKPETEKPETEKPEQEEDSNQNAGQGTMVSQVVSLTNRERAAQGLGALKADSQLSKLAQMKAEDMAKNGYFSHTSPTYGSAFDMLKTYGVSYKTAGENIAKGQKTAQSVMNGWMNSSGHRANILNSSYSEIGVGYAQDSSGTTYWVQIFKG